MNDARWQEDLVEVFAVVRGNGKEVQVVTFPVVGDLGEGRRMGDKAGQRAVETEKAENPQK